MYKFPSLLTYSWSNRNDASDLRPSAWSIHEKSLPWSWGILYAGLQG